MIASWRGRGCSRSSWRSRRPEQEQPREDHRPRGGSRHPTAEGRIRGEPRKQGHCHWWGQADGKKVVGLILAKSNETRFFRQRGFAQIKGNFKNHFSKKLKFYEACELVWLKMKYLFCAPEAPQLSTQTLLKAVLVQYNYKRRSRRKLICFD